MRDRTHMPVRRRRPNGPPQAAGRPLTRPRPARPVFDLTIDGAEMVGLRSAVAGCADELGAGGRVDDVVLVVHELASNVVRHGGGAGRLRLWREDRRIVCRVSDSGPGLADTGALGTEPPSSRVPGGRGLWIARRLADLRIETGPAGTVVTASMSLQGSCP